MPELEDFRDAVREHRRRVGRSQQQLAIAVGVHPNVLSHKLNGHGRAMLTTPEAVRIVVALADWGALRGRAEAGLLLGLAGVAARPDAVVWDVPALASLSGGSDSMPSGAAGADRMSAGAPLRLSRLPAPRTALIGRERERLDVAAAVAESRLVTLTGAGGTGKTRLAVQVAHELAADFADGTAFVDLASLRDAALLPTAVAVACGLAPSAAGDAEALVIAALADRAVLLVVDNVEQVVEGVPILGRLLAAVPGVRVLATSRVPLRLYGEQTIRVPPLRLDDHSPEGPGASDAVRLFLERARAARRDVGTGPDDLAIAARICATVDALPLAIELAAAATRRYGLPELLERLRTDLSILKHGPRDAPGRHQTLRATLDWGFALLPEPARRMLADVSVFAGRFDVPAAAAVSDLTDHDLVADLLVELSEQSMLERSEIGTHFTLLQTVREYAWARLAERGDEDLIERRNLHHLVRRAEEAFPLIGSTSADALTTMEGAYPNVRVAMEFAIRRGHEEPDTLSAGLQLAAAIAPMWMFRTPAAEGLLYLERLLGVQPPDVDVVARATAELRLCAIACFAGEYRVAAAYSGRSAEHFQEIGDHGGVARALRYGGEAAYAVGELDTAADTFVRALGIASAAGDCEARGQAANMLGQLQRHRGRLAEARALLIDAVLSFACTGYSAGMGSATHSLAEVSRDQGDLADARTLYLAALQIAQATGGVRGLAYVFEGLATLATLTGDHLEALRLLGLAQRVRERLGAHLAPVDQARLDELTAPARHAGTPAERQLARARGHEQPAPEAIEDLLRGSEFAGGTVAEMTRRVAVRLEADPAADPAAPHRHHERAGSIS